MLIARRTESFLAVKSSLAMVMAVEACCCQAFCEHDSVHVTAKPRMAQWSDMYAVVPIAPLTTDIWFELRDFHVSLDRAMADDDAIVATQMTPEKGDKLIDSLETGAREDYGNMVQKIVLSCVRMCVGYAFHSTL